MILALLWAKAEMSFTYPFGNTYAFATTIATLPAYLARNPATGLLIADDQTIYYEHYHYGRTGHDRFLSQSMALKL